MNRPRLSLICLGLGLAGFARANDLPVASVPAAGPPAFRQLMPPQLSPQTRSPVSIFRHLLDMSVREREDYLTNRPPQLRAALRAKISEYLAMDPDERELRLRATELRWQLLPLLRMAPADRTARLALVPDDLAPLVQSRLAEWDQLPANLQAEFLANDRTLHYFAHVDPTNQPAAQTAADSAIEEQHQKIAAQFNQFFELTPVERQKTLKTLSPTEQAQMENTLQAFGKLTPQQRFQCLSAFARFNRLSAAERVEFIKNANQWSKLSPKERQSWRDLVARIPTWPPLPPRLLMPPMPPGVPHPPPSAKLHPAIATNGN